MKIFSKLLFLLFAFCLLACSKDDDTEEIKGIKPTGKEIYIPVELKSNDFTSSSSRWCYQRMACSDNIAVFWEKGFGSNPATATKASMRVNIDDLLKKGEEMFAYYSDSLKFIDKNSSKTNTYRIMVMLNYTEDWLATGAGYDDVIGALWVSPSTMQPVGPVIAHELGHAFQYMVSCDGFYGFRNQNYVGMFWEQTSQWMTMQLYPTDLMAYHLPDFLQKTQLHFLDEENRYQSVYLQEYWHWKHGLNIVGRVWREAISPEDPIETYIRITNINQEQFNDEVFEYACHNITWDYPVGNAMNNWMQTNLERKHNTPLTAVGNAWQPTNTSSVDYSPESYGYNAIQLDVPATGTTVEANLKGLNDNTIAGWRWGFVGVKNNNTPIYGAMSSGKEGVASFTVDTNLKSLWLIVTGAPAIHQRHQWVDPVYNDMKFPYKVTFVNTQP